MLRREILKYLSVLPFVDINKLFTGDINKKIVDILYTPLNVSEEKDYIEIPLSLTFDSTDSQGWVKVPFYKSSNIIEDCMENIFVSAKEAGLVCYDAGAPSGVLTDELFSLMISSKYKNSNEIEYFLVSYKFKDQLKNSKYKDKILFYDFDLSDKKYSIPIITYPKLNKNNLIIGIKSSDSLLKIHSKDKVGICYLNDKSSLIIPGVF